MSSGLGVFLVEAIGISLTGVMAPGPVTAATLGLGSRSRHAGALVAVGHGIVEFPLMLLILLGLAWVFADPRVQVGIGLIGGPILLVMGAAAVWESRREPEAAPAAQARGPIVAGIALTAGNPYFLAWWAAAGLNLAVQARSLGLGAFALFAVLHWSCDLVWLELLSWTSFKGSRLLGRRSLKVVLPLCGLVMIAFGARFLHRALAGLLELLD